ncbi:GNAT family N-acetyltransferase [Elioraea sp.]|uniref:GNAT family N-acetyltransferase n=1 Tax=Elioraea sp. TaxID=2185103 RepID=UPI0025C1A4EB|nr:GNAT family N-acetyltransferase [Elioraea sp.]
MAEADHAWVLGLNAAHVSETGPLDQAGLDALLATACHATVAGPEAGFLIAIDAATAHDGLNFRWFAARMDDFVYVDRIVVAAAARRRGIAAALYADLAGAALALGRRALVAEVNIDPPNPGSLAFHARGRFHAVGEAHLAERGKTVRYLRKELA